MKITAIAMCKDEADIIKVTIEHMLTQVDEVIVADNNSTDGTRDILADLPITVLDDPEVGYYQSKKMTDLAKVARNAGAEWIVPFDSDEIWYSTFGTLKELISDIPINFSIVTADLYDHVTSSEDDLTELNPVKRIGWRRLEKGMLPKIACRYRDDLVIQQGNHGAYYTDPVKIREGLLVIRHFPYRSAEHMIHKAINGAAAYAATDLPDYAGAHWRGYGSIIESQGEEIFRKEVYETWFHLKSPRTDPTVIYDPAPVVV